MRPPVHSRQLILFLLLYLFSPLRAQVPPDTSAALHLLKARNFFTAAKPDSGLAEISLARKRYPPHDSSGRLTEDLILADFYFANGLDNAALEMYLVLKASTKVSDSVKAQVFSNLAHIYASRKAYKAAISSDSAAQAYYSGTGNREAMAAVYLHIAGIRFAQNQFSESESVLLRKCLPLLGYDDTARRGTCFIALSATYLALSKTSQAKWFAIQALTVARRSGQARAIANALTALAAVKTRTGELRMALADLQEAFGLARQAGSSGLMADIHRGLYAVYIKMNESGLAATASSASHAYERRQQEQLATRAAAASRIKSLADKRESVTIARQKSVKAAPVKAYTFLYIVILFSLVLVLILFLRSRRK